MAADDEFLARLEAEDGRRRERVRQVIAEAGGPEAVAKFDEQMRLLDLGILTARTAWQSLSEAQQRIMALLQDGGALARSAQAPGTYDAVRGGSHTVMPKAARLNTIRAMADRGLLAWDGGALDPEARAVLTERALFILRHGREAE